MQSNRFPLNLAGIVSECASSVYLFFARYKPGLSLKLLISFVAVALVGVLASSILLLNSLEKQYIDHAITSATRMNLVLMTSLEHAMRTHDVTMLNDIVNRATSNLDGEQIRILDLTGVIRSSSVPAEIGTLISKNDARCQTCHIDEMNGAASTHKILEPDANGEQILLTASPINNQPECSGCHRTQAKTLGMLIIETPLRDLTRQKREGFVSVALTATLLFSILVGLMAPALRKIITTPISELSKGLAEIGAENLDYHVKVDSRDELGQLARALDTMRDQLKSSRAAIILRSQELAILYEVASITGRLLDLEQILNQCLDTLVNQFGLEAGSIFLLDRDRGRFERLTSRGLTTQQLQLIDQRRSKPERDLTHMIAKGGKVFFVPDMSKDPHFIGIRDHKQSYLNVPLKSHGKVVGTLELVSHPEQVFTERQIEIISVVGNQIGIAIENTTLLTETKRKAREALTLYQVSAEVSASLELDQVLRAVASGARDALAGDVCAVCLLDAANQEVAVRATAGGSSDNWLALKIPAEEIQLHKLTKPQSQTGFPPKLSARLMQFLKDEQLNSWVAAPLVRGEVFLGIVVVLARDQRTFTDEEIQLLANLAQQVACAIENAQLYQKVHYIAVLEERDRLAREMHDELAQTLGYLNLQASITSELISSGENVQAQACLLEMKHITRQIYTDTREAIFHLRNNVSSGADLLPMLNEYLAEYSAHYGLDARLVAADGLRINFPTDVALQLSRIIQEGLTNIRKHAQARHAWVIFERGRASIHIVIEDDGCGFDHTTMQVEGAEHYGLQIMRERAESVGATVELTTQIGSGTRVIIRVPAHVCLED